MTPAELLAAIALMPDGLSITVTVQVGDLRRALEQRAGGPVILDTKQAAAEFGYRPERWRRWAEAHQIEGAWQDSKQGPWRLPRASCEAHVQRLRRAGSARATTPSTRSVLRGPWKKNSTASA